MYELLTGCPNLGHTMYPYLNSNLDPILIVRTACISKDFASIVWRVFPKSLAILSPFIDTQTLLTNTHHFKER